MKKEEPSFVNQDDGKRGLQLIACGLMFVWLLQDWTLPSIAGIAAGCAVMVALVAILVFLGVMPAWGVLACCVVASALIRGSITSITGSDVLATTSEAIVAVLNHQNPYTHYYVSSIPSGQPFPYLPGALVFYWLEQLITHSSLTDRWSGIGTVVALASLGPACGYARAAVAVAFFGVCPLLVVLSVDGSNETTLTFLSVLGVAFLVYANGSRGAVRVWLLAGCAAALGWAIAFRAFSWVLFPFISRGAAADGRRFLIVMSVCVAAVMIAPALLADPSAFFRSVYSGATSHREIWGFNVWAALHDFSSARLILYGRRLAAAIAVLVAIGFWIRGFRTLSDAIVAPVLVLTTAFLLAAWSSEAYYSYCLGLAALAFAVFQPKNAKPEHDAVERGKIGALRGRAL